MKSKIFLFSLLFIFIVSLFIVLKSYFSSKKVVLAESADISQIDSFVRAFGYHAFVAFNIDTIREMTTEGSFTRIKDHIEVASKNAREANVSTTFRLDSLLVTGSDSYEAFFTVLLLKDAREISGDIDSIVSDDLKFKQQYSTYTNSMSDIEKENPSSEFLVSREMVSSLKFSLFQSTDSKNPYLYTYRMLINQ